MPETSDIKYVSIFRTLRAEIFAGKYAAAVRFPSEAQLQRRFGASRQTVVRVMLELEKYGLVARRRGSGTFLTPIARAEKGRLGMIVPGQRTVEIFTPICAEIAHCVRAAGYQLDFGDVSAADPRVRVRQAQALAAQYAQEGVAGVFFEPIERLPESGSYSREILSFFDERRIPVVLLDRDVTPPESRSAYDLVGIDNFRAGETLVRHLMDAGARRIRYFMCPDSAPTLYRRAQGVAAGLAAAGRRTYPSLVAEPDDVPAVRRLLARAAPDALVCGNDRTAALLLQTLTRLGRRVPQDLLLAGFDDVRVAAVLSPPLTSMRQPCDDIARVAVEMLLNRIAHPDAPARAVALEAALVVRSSTRRTP